jgi:hypothetical protein
METANQDEEDELPDDVLDDSDVKIIHKEEVNAEDLN